MVLTTTGNLGIGTTGPTSKLEVSGGDVQVSGSGYGLTFDRGSDGANVVLRGGLTISHAGLDYGISAAGSEDFGIYGSAFGTSYLTVRGSSGNVGIGTTGPSYLLHLSKSASSDNVSVAVDNTSTSGTARVFARANVGGSQSTVMMQAYGSTYVGNNSFGQSAASTAEIYSGVGGGMTIGNVNNDKLYFGTNSLIRATIDSTGNVGIGTIAPLSKLGVVGNASIGATYGAFAGPQSG